MIFILICNTAFGQQKDTPGSSDTLKNHKLNILSNIENSKIFFDTVYVGVTPLYNYNVTEGLYKIRIYNPVSLKNWETENQSLDIYIISDTTVTADFRYFYFFNTNPYGARIFLNKDSLLGSSPLRMFSEKELQGNLLFKKQNYKDYFFDLKTYNFETGANITLQPKGKETVNDLVYKNRGTQFKTKRALIPILSLAAASVTGGYFALNFKNKANDAYDKYLDNGNSSSLDESKKNDTYFVISLVLMQAAVGGLIYFLFFD